jgi:hypothetical protein
VGRWVGQTAQRGGTPRPSSCSPLRRPSAHRLQAGPGVKSLSENDWVIPLAPSMGTWRTLAGEGAVIAAQPRKVAVPLSATLRGSTGPTLRCCGPRAHSVEREGPAATAG